MSAAPPEKKLRIDRLLIALVVLGGIGVGVYFLVG